MYGILQPFVFDGRSRDEVVGVFGVFDEVGGHFKDFGLYFGLDERFFERGSFLGLIFGFDVDAYDALLLLVFLDVALGGVEVHGEQLQAVVKEVARLYGLKVFFFNAACVILAHDLVENVLAVSGVWRVYAHAYDVGALGRDAHADVFGHVFGGLMVAHEHDVCLDVFVGGIAFGGAHGETTVRRVEHVWQFYFLLVYYFFIVGDDCHFGLTLAVSFYLEYHRCRECVEHGGWRVDLYGIVFEFVHRVEESFSHIVATVEVECLYGFAVDGV